MADISHSFGSSHSCTRCHKQTHQIKTKMMLGYEDMEALKLLLFNSKGGNFEKQRFWTEISFI